MHDASALVEQPADAASADLACPMCEYDLRGLPEPRCPECGYAFDWADLLDPTRRKHKYLFEHHPQHNIWSFCRTAVGGLVPWRFWRSLRPEQPSNVRRLIVYWLITTAGMFILPLGLFAAMCIPLHRNNARARPGMIASAKNPQEISWIKTYYGSVDAYLEEMAPVAPSAAFFAKVWRTNWTWTVVIAAVAGACFIAMPWLTVLSLMIFQSTMRRTKVRSAHVLRCCLYSFDGAWWYGLLMAVVVAGLIYDATQSARFQKYTPYAPTVIRFTSTALLIFSAVKLLLAYHLYMRFPRPAATVSLALAVATLAVIVILLNTPGLEIPLDSAWRAL